LPECDLLHVDVQILTAVLVRAAEPLPSAGRAYAAMHAHDWAVRVPHDELLCIPFEEFEEVSSAHLFEFELRRFELAVATWESLWDLALEGVEEPLDSVTPQEVVMGEPP
jgi:hypothetical protein